jgi:hypothetical protein
MSFPTPGWGSSWTPGAWGSTALSLSSLFVVSAAALNTRTVRVVLSALPQQAGIAIPNDILNPATWTVQRLDTAAFFTVLLIDPTADPLSFDVTVLEDFGPVSVTHRVTAATLKSVLGALIGSPDYADFLGLSSANAVAPVAPRTRDYANAPTPFNPLGGTLQITAAGDYATIGGKELLRKLIVRRLITSPGEFFHLPEYGVGLRVKEPLPAADLTKLRAEIERQILLEPDVVSVRVSLRFTPAQGTLEVAVFAKAVIDGQATDIDASTSIPLVGT